MPIALNVHIAGQGFPILCLHGHPGSSRCMEVFTQPLSQQFQMIAPDLRGYGGSPAHHAFTMQDHLADLHQLLDQLNIDRYIALGWSLGGILAMELALSHGDRLAGLILVATAAHPRSNHPPVRWMEVANTGIASIVNRLVPGWQWNIDTFGRRSLYQYLIQRHTPSTYQYLADAALSAYLQTSRHATAALNQAIRSGYNRTADLSSIACPALVLAGECDRHIMASASAETAQQLQQGQFQQYPNTAHLFPWEVPQDMITDIQAWLADLQIHPADPPG
ncbi:alpha/beta hydrolase [Leptolyngbya sp. CCY15150]|uniref:alpha/beta fold hydrolase n=1 Tax=Leptolyngbya sp. CCY15150 TaxID=2767772 RepID=UPI00194FD362|nr:alpha/beta hydrolase [Leptolyngbya sp. CCY15150]